MTKKLSTLIEEYLELKMFRPPNWAKDASGRVEITSASAHAEHDAKIEQAKNAIDDFVENLKNETSGN